MPVTFDSIPLDIRTTGQYVEFNSSRAVQGLPSLPHVAMIVAPRLTTGNVAAAIPFLISSPDVGEAGFGRHSIGSFMAKAFKANNPYTEVWGIGVADSGVAKAAGSFVFTGPATAAGVLHAYIGGIHVPVAVTSAMTADQLGAALVAEMANYELPVTGVNTTGSVAITARNAGTVGNRIDLRVNHQRGEVLPAGIGCTVTAMSAGAVDGSISGAIAAMAGVQYHTIASAYDDDTNLDLFEAELLTRWGPMEQREGHLFAATPGTQGAMSSAGNARNSLLSSLMGSGKSPTPSYVWAAAVAARDAFECTVDPNRPRQTLPLVGCVAPKPEELLTRTERNTLLTDGVSTFLVDASGQVTIERLITTYQLNAAGVADTAYLDIMKPRTLAAMRYTERARIALKFPRHKLADDGTNFGPGQPIVTPSAIRTELIDLFQVWIGQGWTEDVEQYKTDLVVERSVTDKNRVNVLQSPNLVDAFMVFAAQMQWL